jgi:hypothetical protein
MELGFTKSGSDRLGFDGVAIKLNFSGIRNLIRNSDPSIHKSITSHIRSVPTIPQ